MTNSEIASLLKQVAATYIIKNDKKYYFQMLAYQRATESIESLTTEVADLYKDNALDTIPGVGKSIREYLTELITKGKSPHIDAILSEAPEAMFPLLDIPSFGPKKAYKLVTLFKLSNPKTVINDVTELAKKGEIANLEGFGEKSQKDILQAISEFKEGVNKSTRMVLPVASEIADKVVSYMKQCEHVQDISVLGSLRRKKETIGDIDIAVASDHPEIVLTFFTSYPYKTRVIEKGDATASILVSGGKHIDLMVQPKKRFGSLLQHFTGSKEHNIKLREHALKQGLSLSEYGIKIITQKSSKQKVRESEETWMFSSEPQFYDALGLPFIPPEIREGTNEIEFAKNKNLPSLVMLSDIQGDFHLHSSFTIEPSHDLGKSTIETMVTKADALGYHSVGFSEHNPSMKGHTTEQMITLVQKRNNVIDQAQKNNKSVRIYKLLETDILPSGKLAISDDVLALLDATIVSVHSSFTMQKTDMTKRVIAGLSHKKAKILAHPTGRLINQRPGYELNWNELFQFCRKENKALEINAWPSRLDLKDTLVHQAVDQGVLLIVNTDSHDVSHMNLMRYGVDVARRGWAAPKNIVNTWSKERIEKWLTST